MKRKNLLLNFWLMLMLFGAISSPTVFGQTATLTHSYTFEDGTANDVVGSADGVLQGDATVANGALTLSGTGYVSLPGKDINIPSYSSLSIETVFKQAPPSTGITDQMTVIYAFGETNPDVDWMGINYLLWQPTRQDNANARASISCGNTGDPWATEDGVNAPEIADTITHYAVTVLNSSEIRLYIDGQLIGTSTLTGSNALDSISADTAYIGKDVYPGDPLWQGSVKEMNIYEGELDAATITQHAKDYLGATFTDATLDTLYANTGVMDPAFDPATDLYQLSVPYGTTSIHLIALPKVSGATVSMVDGLGNEYTGNDTIGFTGDGIDLEIDVTALDGTTQKAYYLSIFTDNSASAATLSSINLSAGNLTSDFIPDSLKYTAVVPYGTASVEVTGVPTWDKATVTGGGAVDVSSGSATTSITVTSEDGTKTLEYTLDIYVSKVTTDTYYYIQHEASGLVVGESGDTYDLIRLYHPLLNEKSQLFKFVDSGVAGQYYLMNQNNNYLTLTADPTWDMIMTPTLTQDKDSCRFVLDEFEPGRFKIQSVARMSTDNYNMGTNDTNVGTGVYSDKWPDNDLAIWNIKAPNEVVDPYDTYLSSLSVNGVSISPSFDPFTTEYYVTLPVGTNSIDIAAVPRDATSTVAGTGTMDVSDGEGTITITITATDASYTRDYVIHYLSDTPLTLTHSYTFADGTAKDVVGNADGTVHGGMISKGMYTASANGEYISLPAEQIAINTYPTVTVEAYLQDVDTTTNDANTMISYFGNTTVDNYGTDYFFTSLKARAAISCLNPSSPWSAESGVSSVNILDDGLAHHIVSVLNNDSISFYVDGLFAGADSTSDANKVYNISNALAYLCKSGYTGDKTWLGQILEFNIYSGQMDAQTVATRA
ncbi:MAG TPA: cadherin-like beta sandwich domain-containing protein, partial [Bacteroidales bacterium]|nr:cadherin-like beta sandwich domain-containing protein [Bacteroidales bacterium]